MSNISRNLDGIAPPMSLGRRTCMVVRYPLLSHREFGIIMDTLGPTEKEDNNLFYSSFNPGACQTY